MPARRILIAPLLCAFASCCLGCSGPHERLTAPPMHASADRLQALTNRGLAPPPARSATDVILTRRYDPNSEFGVLVGFQAIHNGAEVTLAWKWDRDSDPTELVISIDDRAYRDDRTDAVVERSLHWSSGQQRAELVVTTTPLGGEPFTTRSGIGTFTEHGSGTSGTLHWKGTLPWQPRAYEVRARTADGREGDWWIPIFRSSEALIEGPYFPSAEIPRCVALNLTRAGATAVFEARFARRLDLSRVTAAGELGVSTRLGAIGDPRLTLELLPRGAARVIEGTSGAGVVTRDVWTVDGQVLRARVAASRVPDPLRALIVDVAASDGNGLIGYGAWTRRVSSP